MQIAQLHFSGEVSHLDPNGRTFAVRERGGKSGKQMTFALAPDGKIVQGSELRSIGELRLGERVKVSYADQGSTHQAKQVEVLAAGTSKAAPAKAASARSKAS